MQVGGAVGDGHRLNIAETAGLIMREKGPRGFFVGLTIGYAKVVPMAAVSFYVYERGKTWLRHIEYRPVWRNGVCFLSACGYPFQYWRTLLV